MKRDHNFTEPWLHSGDTVLMLGFKATLTKNFWHYFLYTTSYKQHDANLSY